MTSLGYLVILSTSLFSGCHTSKVTEPSRTAAELLMLSHSADHAIREMDFSTLDGKKLFSSQLEFKQYFPKNGWVEHNPNEIWLKTLKVIKNVGNKCKKNKIKIITIGITNQRETTVLWDKTNGKPVYNAIVWQDRRTENYCKKIKNKENLIRKKTGLFIDPYFSATKIKWVLDNVTKAKKLLKKNLLLFGTIDSFLI